MKLILPLGLQLIVKRPHFNKKLEFRALSSVSADRMSTNDHISSVFGTRW